MTPYHVVLLIIALERFSWYLLLGSLALWRSPAEVGSLLFWAYLMPLVGGLLGRYSLRATVAAGATLLLAGYVFASANHFTLPLLAAGVGLFKPCLSALLGSLFQPGPTRTAAFGRYYGAIQVGAMPSTLVGGYLHYRYGWGAAFAACAVALGAALAAIVVYWEKLKPAQQSLSGSTIETILDDRPQWRRLVVLLVGAVAFFTGFQQQQTSLVIWARDVCRVDLPETVSTLNPVFAIVLLASPLAAWRDLRSRLTVGLAALAAGFALLLCGDSLRFLVGWYVLATIGEVLVNPLGLDLACGLVPRRHSALATALWLSAMAFGGKLAGVLGSAQPRVAVVASLLIAAAGAAWFYLLTPRSERATLGAKNSSAEAVVAI